MQQGMLSTKVRKGETFVTRKITMFFAKNEGSNEILRLVTYMLKGIGVMLKTM